MNIYEYELFYKESGEKGEILKTSTGYLVKKYRNFTVMYYSKKVKIYSTARAILTEDGFRKMFKI